MAQSERAVALRVRLADCLTDPGIVRFPVAFGSKHGRGREEATGKRYEAGEGVSASLTRSATARGRPGTAPSAFALPLPCLCLAFNPRRNPQKKTPGRSRQPGVSQTRIPIPTSSARQ